MVDPFHPLNSLTVFVTNRYHYHEFSLDAIARFGVKCTVKRPIPV